MIGPDAGRADRGDPLRVITAPNPDDPLRVITALRVVPVVVLDDARAAPALGAALHAAGLPVVEVTLRTPAAVEAIVRLAEDPRLLVGAGTVRTAAQVDRATEAGARFVVSPGFSPSVVAQARERGLPVLPGVATATEVMAALDAGVEMVKFFPAETCGGVAGLRALAAPFPDVRFVPTGGVTAASLRAYLDLPSVVAVGGSWMVARELLRDGRFAEVTRLAAAAVALAGGVAG